MSSRAAFRHDFLHRPDGAELYVQQHGTGAQGLPGMVLCDGLGCDGFAWQYLLPELAKNHRVVRWHYRGHGDSSVPADHRNIGMSFNCDDLGAVMDHAQLPKVILFGHSMGVQVALEFHRRAPERVLGMVLICGSYGRPLDTFHDTPYLNQLLPYLKEVVERFPRAARRANQLAMSTELALEVALSVELNRQLMKRKDLTPYFDHLARMDPLVFLRTLTSLADHSALDHLGDVQVPVLVIGGEKDHFTPAWLSHRMAYAIPQAELLMIPGGSHTAPLEAPELIWEHVSRFLSNRIA